MAKRQWSRILGAACGVLFVALLLGGDTGEKPDPDATDAEVAQFFQDNPPTHMSWAGVWIESIALLLFLVFALTLVSAIPSQHPGGRIGAATASGAAIAATATKFASFPAVLFVMHRVEDGRPLDPAIAGALLEMNSLAFEVGWLLYGLFLLGLAWGALTTRALPKALSIFALVAAAALLVGFALRPAPVGVFGFLGFLLWNVVASIVLIRKAWRSGATAPASDGTRAAMGGAA